MKERYSRDNLIVNNLNCLKLLNKLSVLIILQILRITI